MNQIVSDGIHVVRATGQKMRTGVEHAADGVKHEMHEVRERFGPHKQPSRWRRISGHGLQLVASTVGAVAAFFISVLIRRGRSAKRK